MNNENQLKGLEEVDITTVDIDLLKDIRDVKIDNKLPIEERMIDFVRQIKNPYCFKCGKIVVQIEHNKTNKTINDCLKEYIESQAY